MRRLALSLVAGTNGECRMKGCVSTALLYGYCADHEQEVLQEYFANAVLCGYVSAAIPNCFTTAQQYLEYSVTTLAGLNGSAAEKPRVEICRDCDPKYKNQMMREGRCDHPETVFIRRPDRMGGDVIGIAIDAVRRSTTAWESAMMGVAGEIISLPPHAAIDDALQQIYKDGAAKKKRFRSRIKKKR